MKLDPNRYKACVPTILRMYENCKHKDIHDITNDVGLGTGIDFAAVCIIIYAHTGDERFPEQIKMLINFFKYDTIVEYDKAQRTSSDPDDLSGQNISGVEDSSG